MYTRRVSRARKEHPRAGGRKGAVYLVSSQTSHMHMHGATAAEGVRGESHAYFLPCALTEGCPTYLLHAFITCHRPAYSVVVILLAPSVFSVRCGKSVVGKNDTRRECRWCVGWHTLCDRRGRCLTQRGAFGLASFTPPQRV